MTSRPNPIDAIALLASLPVAARARTRTRMLAAGELLFARDTRPVAMYAVVAGEVRLVRHSASGTQIVLQRTHRGFVAEASLDQPAYHCDAIAAVESDVVTIPMPDFRRALETAEFRQLWLRHLSRELRRARAQNERLSLRSAEERIIHYLESEGISGQVELPGTRRDWAVELGLTHEALYRALAKMEGKGRITLHGRRIGLV